ncbi:ribonuclease J [Telmatospirillum sp.]|uniref:ribonuclease J n=1 Tax=Telmatospirillum sp. TaxID=2079197 RepID=UPI002846E9FB|nr:ribonuclease J [Telmatospirillum sp.]MDR3439823.1 ribonuclease J [Telmatospirillum sp.]
MPRLPRPRASEIVVVPVGGLGRIGMNWTLYGHDGRWILADAGIAFPEDRSGAVDAFIPDPEALRRAVGRIDALIVTHAHEDHIGAIQYVFPRLLSCPIWATPFASAAISRRLEEAGTLGEADLRTFPVGGAFRIGPFAIRSIRLTHSVPEAVAFAIATPAGTVLHTGDFKLDPTPLIGEPTDLETIHALGNAGLLAMVCDSTNAERDLPVTSEAQVRESLRRIFASRAGAVVVCCFGTNIVRAMSAADAALRSGRQIAFAGRSLRAHAETADHLGLVDTQNILAEPSHLQGLDQREIALVCTGTQGEENAALARFARGMDWRLPRLGLGDTLVMSASVIPGNEDEIARVLEPLRERGVEILTQRDAPDGLTVHVSGHAGRAELATMHRHARPRFVIPVHGTEAHLQAHAILARDCGAEETAVGTTGEAMAISASGIKRLGRIEVPILGVRRDEGILSARAAKPAGRKEASLQNASHQPG